jgi:predicted transcriptional regulator
MTAAFTVRLDDATLKTLDELAEKTDRPRSWLVSRAIEDYVALNAWQIERIEEGLAAVEKGDFASESEMQRLRAKYARHK